jgi:hypothetical protein
MVQRTTIVGAVAVSLAGCSSYIFRPFDINDGTSYSLDAKQRVVLVNENGGKERNRRVVCAEPSPDAITAHAAAVSAALQAPLGGFGAQSDAQAKAAQGAFRYGSEDSVASIANRTQTVQLLRDNLYRACEAYMNGAIDSAQYNLIVINIDKLMTALVAIDALGSSGRAPPPVTITASQPPPSEPTLPPPTAKLGGEIKDNNQAEPKALANPGAGNNAVSSLTPSDRAISELDWPNSTKMMRLGVSPPPEQFGPAAVTTPAKSTNKDIENIHEIAPGVKSGTISEDTTGSSPVAKTIVAVEDTQKSLNDVMTELGKIQRLLGSTADNTNAQAAANQAAAAQALGWAFAGQERAKGIVSIMEMMKAGPGTFLYTCMGFLADSGLDVHTLQQRQLIEFCSRILNHAAVPILYAGVGMRPPVGPSRSAKSSGPSRSDFVAELQRELSRVGCDPGRIDGAWGEQSRSALAEFGKLTKSDTRYRLEEGGYPTPQALTAVAAQKDRVCAQR